MSLGRSKQQQKSMWLSYDQLPQSQDHIFYERIFYERLQKRMRP